MEKRKLTKRTEITGKANTYNCFYEDYTLLKKYNHIIDKDFLYVVASIYLQGNQRLRNYSYINLHNSIDDFLLVDLSIVSNMTVYFIDLQECGNLTLSDVVDDIKSNYKEHNFCIDKLPQSL